MDYIYYTTFPTAMGEAAFAESGGMMVGSWLPGMSHPELEKQIKARFPYAIYTEGLKPEWQRMFKDYFRGEPVRIDIPVDLSRLTRFQQDVLRALMKVPRGETIAYGELAERCGHPDAARAVGSTMAANPIPLVIPCHRVVQSDGTAGGFSASGGALMKKRMLEMERPADGTNKRANE